MSLITILIYLIFNLGKTDGKTASYTKIYLVAIICGLLAYRVSAFTRIQMYFDVFSVVYLPYLFAENAKRRIIAGGGESAKIVIFDI